MNAQPQVVKIAIIYLQDDTARIGLEFSCKECRFPWLHPAVAMLKANKSKAKAWCEANFPGVPIEEHKE